jgi:hypothetical protein
LSSTIFLENFAYFYLIYQQNNFLDCINNLYAFNNNAVNKENPINSERYRKNLENKPPSLPKNLIIPPKSKEEPIKTPLNKTPNKEKKEKNSIKYLPANNNLLNNNNLLIKNEEVDSIFLKPKKESFNSNRDSKKREEQIKKEEIKKIESEKDRETERKEMLNDIKQKVLF